ncbi:hypothetical protein RZ532_19315 [Nitratireductor aquimarinus]|uniref:hypothetical protein n=1 Tax=Nitratireductor aquimarinus TaxID=889300 RepID=UPI002935A9E2|nr:hypothetical protein [Nitratireductor aquimarinus]MDV2968148.1 hypothetical protein [Nitratireductor aquimarinus]
MASLWRLRQVMRQRLGPALYRLSNILSGGRLAAIELELKEMRAELRELMRMVGNTHDAGQRKRIQVFSRETIPETGAKELRERGEE